MRASSQLRRRYRVVPSSQIEQLVVSDWPASVLVRSYCRPDVVGQRGRCTTGSPVHVYLGMSALARVIDAVAFYLLAAVHVYDTSVKSSASLLSQLSMEELRLSLTRWLGLVPRQTSIGLKVPYPKPKSKEDALANLE